METARAFRILALAALAPAAARGSRSPGGVPIVYHASAMQERPTVGATLRGAPLEMLIDTGSSRSFVSPRAAKRAGILPRAARAIGVDVLNRPIEGYPVDQDELRVGPFGEGASVWVSTFGDDVETSGAARVEHATFDGVVAPADLVPPGRALVIDLQNGELRAAPWDQALAQAHAAGARLASAPVVIDEDGKFVVVAAVGGRRMRLAIDTGAPVTALFAPRDPDLPEGLTETDRRRVRVQVGEVESDLDVARIQPLRGGGRGYDGLLGMDVLHGCVLALDGEKLVAGCGAPSHEVTPSHLMAMREGVPERDRLRPRMVQWNGRGPALTAHPNGTYTWEGQYVIGEIGRDGHVTIRPRPWWETWDNPIESRDDDRSEERWFRDETQAMRTELWMDEARRLADQSIDGLPSYLAGLWGTGLPAQLRRAELFELWDEAEEPDDPELGVAGAKARAVVDRFIRQNLPRGSRDGFSESELAAFNARRARGPHFTPYDGPRPIPHDTAE